MTPTYVFRQLFVVGLAYSLLSPSDNKERWIEFSTLFSKHHQIHKYNLYILEKLFACSHAVL